MNRVAAGLLSLLVITMLAGPSAPARADEASFDRKIKKLMEMTDTSSFVHTMVPQIFRQITGILQRSNPSIPKQAFEDFQQEFTATFLESAPQFIDSLLPVYKKHFDEADIDALIAFYETPTGQKAIKKLPQIFQESFTIGQIWGLQVSKEATRRLKERLRAKGYDI